ncbi:hypothetical protein [Fluviispira vulneris]|uniref:hypothetical protein n=1 Tax=Fluviispira vulneris TaxID=2763012 RepID=UPI00164466C3|nr:hypothetical protein [Fluviispira vulneris]
MIVKQICERRDGRIFLEIEVDGETMFYVRDGEAEDNNLYRNFNDCFSVTELMELAYDAGKNGEEFVLIKEEIEE